MSIIPCIIATQAAVQTNVRTAIKNQKANAASKQDSKEPKGCRNEDSCCGADNVAEDKGEDPL